MSQGAKLAFEKWIIANPSTPRYRRYRYTALETVPKTAQLLCLSGTGGASRRLDKRTQLLSQADSMLLRSYWPQLVVPACFDHRSLIWSGAKRWQLTTAEHKWQFHVNFDRNGRTQYWFV